jgi:hypothetical protein
MVFHGGEFYIRILILYGWINCEYMYKDDKVNVEYKSKKMEEVGWGFDFCGRFIEVI